MLSNSSNHPEVILYHYPGSPYARRVVWYLNLRKIPYKQCIQPVTLPRPILASLGLSYRRIPFLTINSSLYIDTRLILSTLEALYPPSAAHPSITPSDASSLAIQHLLNLHICDGPIFMRASQLLPPSLPLLRDEKFQKDREQLTGQSWSESAILSRRPEAISAIKTTLQLFESLFFSDGKKWVLGGEEPSMADLEAVWPFVWLKNIPGALEDKYFGDGKYKKTFEWIDRFDTWMRRIEKENGKTEKITNEEAISIVEKSEFVEGLLAVNSVNEADESGLRKGDEVQVWPIDSGSRNRDHGKLVGLSGDEIVWQTHTISGKIIRVHAPRRGFRMKAYKASVNL